MAEFIAAAVTVSKIVRKICDVANAMTSNEEEGISLALRVQAIEEPLRERAAASKAAQDMVMHELHRIATFLEQFGPNQPWGKQISNGLNADGIKADFKAYREILRDLITDTEMVRAHAAEQLQKRRDDLEQQQIINKQNLSIEEAEKANKSCNLVLLKP
jgi:hypothetical protein